MLDKCLMEFQWVKSGWCSYNMARGLQLRLFSTIIDSRGGTTRRERQHNVRNRVEICVILHMVYNLKLKTTR